MTVFPLSAIDTVGKERSNQCKHYINPTIRISKRHLGGTEHLQPTVKYTMAAENCQHTAE